jgi:uncharacterized cupin superfamily protein
MKKIEFILNTSNVPRRTAKVISTGESLGVVADLAQLAGLRHLRIQHEILLSGRRSSSPHAHTMREEFIYVLQGHPDVWLDGEVHRLKPGDCVALCAGTGIAHSFLNNGEGEVHLLAIASVPEQDGTFYPLTGRRDDVPEDIANEWSTRNRGPHNGLPDRQDTVTGTDDVLSPTRE